MTETVPATGRTERSELVRARMIAAAEELLNAAPDHDISTRAVCEAVGVGQPILYRLFGDKEGLLAAVVDEGFGRYIARKQSLERTDDPVADLRAGWDDHMAFALANPAVYRLMYSPVLRTMPAAAGRIFDLLVEQLERCAAAGVTAVASDRAAQAILSANVGVALSVLSQPDRFAHPEVSTRVRDAVFADILLPDARTPASHGESRGLSAVHVEALLRQDADERLGAEERALMLKWLDRLREPANG
jgi:AcrR family transcriptional regulator